MTINFGTVLSYPDITIGSNVWLGTYNNVGHVDIGDYVIAARNCHFVSGQHGHPFERTDIPIMLQQGKAGRIQIGPDVWLGSGAIVMCDVGKGCVVGAGSVVTHNIPDWVVVAGNPARILKYRKPREVEGTRNQYHNECL